MLQDFKEGALKFVFGAFILFITVIACWALGILTGAWVFGTSDPDGWENLVAIILGFCTAVVLGAIAYVAWKIGDELL